MTRQPVFHFRCNTLDGVDANVLRWILTLVVPRSEMSRFIPLEHDVTTMWPSSIYRLAAEHIARSESLWTICEYELQMRLSRWLKHYDRLSPWKICHNFQESKDAMVKEELATVLWVLLRRRDPVLTKVIWKIQEETALLWIPPFSHPAQKVSCKEGPLNDQQSADGTFSKPLDGGGLR